MDGRVALETALLPRSIFADDANRPRPRALRGPPSRSSNAAGFCSRPRRDSATRARLSLSLRRWPANTVTGRCSWPRLGRRVDDAVRWPYACLGARRSCPIQASPIQASCGLGSSIPRRQGCKAQRRKGTKAPRLQGARVTPLVRSRVPSCLADSTQPRPARCQSAAHARSLPTTTRRTHAVRQNPRIEGIAHPE